MRSRSIRSDNGGSKWEMISPKIGPQNRHAVTLDPYIFVDRATGRVFNIDLTVACSLLSYSDDQGASWITNPLACGRPVNDHQTLFGGPPATSTTIGYENVMYYCWNDVASSQCSKSIDGGLTFASTGGPAYTGYQPDEETVGFYGQKGLCGGLHGHGVVGPDGTVYLPRELCGRPMVAISKDEGLTWEQVQVAPRAFMSSNDNSIAVDGKNNLYYVGVTKQRLPFLVYSRNGGKKWSAPIDISAPGLTEANLVTIDSVAPGKVAIAYMGSENSPYQKCSKKENGCEATDYEKTTWNGYLTISANLFDKQPTFHTATVNDPKDPMKRRTCGPRRCGSTIFDFIDVVIGADGIAYTAWTDACTLLCANGGVADTGNEGLMAKMVGGPSLR